MCKYCDCKSTLDIILNDEKQTILIATEYISNGDYGCCYICNFKGKFYIIFLDEHEFLSKETIMYCPYCGSLLVLTEEMNNILNPQKTYDNIYDYIRSLKDGTDKWRYAIKYATEHIETMTVEEMIKHIEKHTEKW